MTGLSLDRFLMKMYGKNSHQIKKIINNNLPDANVRAITFTGTFPFTSTVNPKRIQLLIK